MHFQFFYSVVIANSKLDYYTTSNIIFLALLQNFITNLNTNEKDNYNKRY